MLSKCCGKRTKKISAVVLSAVLLLIAIVVCFVLFFINESQYHEDAEPYMFIPSMIAANEESIFAGNYPYIVFNEDMTCDVVFNMAEWMMDLRANFQMLQCESGGRIIKIDLETVELGDGKEHSTAYFYLIESNDGSWSYFGEGIGLITAGTVYTPVDEVQLLITNVDTIPNAANLLGNYDLIGGMYDTLTVKDEKAGKTIIFDADWYRIAGIDGAEGYLYGNLAFFKYIVDDYYYETYGVLEFMGDGTINMTLFETGLPYIKEGTYTYQLDLE